MLLGALRVETLTLNIFYNSRYSLGSIVAVSSTKLPEWVWNLIVTLQSLPHVWGGAEEGRCRGNHGGLK